VINLSNQSLILFLFILFFVEYTSARSPSDYCNNIASPPEYKICFKGIGMFELSENFENTITLSEIPSVSQDEIFNIVERTNSLSDADKSKRQKIDQV